MRNGESEEEKSDEKKSEGKSGRGWWKREWRQAGRSFGKTIREESVRCNHEILEKQRASMPSHDLLIPTTLD